jgi:hypothetical protein
MRCAGAEVSPARSIEGVFALDYTWNATAPRLALKAGVAYPTMVGGCGAYAFTTSRDSVNSKLDLTLVSKSWLPSTAASLGPSGGRIAIGNTACFSGMDFDSEGSVLAGCSSFPIYLASIDFSSASVSVCKAMLARSCKTFRSISSCRLSSATILIED